MIQLNTIYNTDCLEGMKDIPSGSVDMVLCDLPYGTTDCGWDSVIPFSTLWWQYNRITKPAAAVVLTASQPFTTSLINSNAEAFRYCWVWVKTNASGFANAKRRPLKTYEDIVVFCRNSPKYFPQGLRPLMKPRSRKAKVGDTVSGNGFYDGYQQTHTDYPKNVLNVASERGLHPTQKPVALFEYLIRTYTNPGETVLDNCMGSGTTAIACLNANRNYIGFELDKTYYDKSLARIASHQVPQMPIAA